LGLLQGATDRRMRSLKEEVAMWDAALEPIDEEHCVELLKGVEYGRVAVATGEGRPPEIFPVNFASAGIPSSSRPGRLS
jgi:hypothetical protein